MICHDCYFNYCIVTITLTVKCRNHGMQRQCWLGFYLLHLLFCSRSSQNFPRISFLWVCNPQYCSGKWGLGNSELGVSRTNTLGTSSLTMWPVCLEPWLKFLVDLFLCLGCLPKRRAVLWPSAKSTLSQTVLKAHTTTHTLPKVLFCKWIISTTCLSDF